MSEGLPEQQLKGMGSWQLFAFSVAMAQALSLGASYVISLIWWGEVSWNLIGLTALCVLLVSLALAALVIFGIQRTGSNRAMFLRLQREVSRRREQERQLASIIANTPDIIYRLDAEGRITFISEAVSRLGVKPVDLVGRPVWDVVHLDDREDSRRAVETLRAGHALPRGLEIKLIRLHDGQAEPRHFQINAEGLYSDEPRGPQTFIGTQGVARDVTALKRAKEERRRSEEDFRLLFEHSPDGIVVANQDSGRFQYMNPAFCAMLGYSADQCPELSVQTIHPPRDLDRVRGLFERMCRGELALAKEVPCLRSNGDVFYADIHAAPASGFGGGVIIGFFRDVTDRVKVERRLRDGEAKFRLFTDEVSVDGLIIHDQGRILEVSQPFARMHGYLREELIGMEALRLIAPKERAAVGERIGSSNEGAYQTVGLRKDGSQFPCEIRVKNLFYQGRQVRAAAVRDITERVQADRSIRDAEERYRTLFERAGDAIFLISAEEMDEGTIVDANLAAAAMHGREPEELQGMRIMDLVTPETSSRIRSMVGRMLKGEWINLEGEHLRKDGSHFTVEISAGLVQLGGKRYVLGIDRDVSQRKEAEAQRRNLEGQLRQTQRLEALGTLAGGIAHDFNNILAAVLGHAELAGILVQRGEDPSRPLGGVVAACRRARELIARILTFSRSGEEELGPVDVRPVVEEALNILRAGLPPGVALEPDLRDEAVVMGDASQIHQVVLNLCANAGQAMADKGGSISVSLKRVLPQGSLAQALASGEDEVLELAVTDTGPGMAPQTVERIFDPFFTTKPPLEGTGLGLSVVHGIVQKMGGHVSCESAPGRGSVFRVWLPLMDGAAAAAAEPALPAERAGSERLLLVDDEEDLARLTGEMLGYLGYQVVLAHSGDEAWRTFSHRPGDYDLVITDHYMPGISGRELAQRLRQARPELPVILCTGGAAASGPGELGEAEVDLVLAKPLAIGELATAVREVLDSRRAHARPSASMVE